ncbi:MAG: hypothetical protein AAFQ67_00615, partial [Pseudomonadota bacterium]
TGRFGRVSKIGAVSVIALAAAGVAQAQDATNAGTRVENTFTLSYSVDSTAQPTITNDPTSTGPGFDVQGALADASFTVDRIINHTVTAGAAEVEAAPGNTAAQVTFTLQNDGNDAQSYILDVVDIAGDLGVIGGASLFYQVGAATPVAITEVDSTTAAWTANNANVTPDIQPGDSITIIVQASIPAGTADDEFDDLGLLAQARTPTAWTVETTSLTAGDVLSEDSDGNAQNGLAENVFADADGPVAGDGATDAIHSAESTLTVISPELEGAKDVLLLSNSPTFDCATIPTGASTEDSTAYFVSGACVEYVITVTNTSDNDSADAAITAITDTLPEDLRFVAVSVDGFTDYVEADDLSAPAANTVCRKANPTDPDLCVVSVSDVTLPANTTIGVNSVATIRIRAEVL